MNPLPDEVPLVGVDLSRVGTLKRRDEGVSTTAESTFDRVISENPSSIASVLRSGGLLETGIGLRAIAQQVANVDVMMGAVDLDNLLTRLVLFETKLFRNPESTRQVLAQIFDYASRKWTVDEVINRTSGETRKWLQEQRDTLEDLLTRGDFLLVIAGDRVQPRLVQIAKGMLDRHTFKGVELALLSMAVFEGQGLTLVIPNLVGAVTTAARELHIRVNVQLPDGTPVKASPELEDEVEPAPAKTLWNEASFLQTVKSRWPDWEAGMRSFLEFVARTPNLSLRWTKAANACVNVDVERSDGNVRVLWASAHDASFSIWRNTLVEELGEVRTNQLLDELSKTLDVPIRASAYPYIGNDENYLDLRNVKHREILFDWLKRLTRELRSE